MSFTMERGVYGTNPVQYRTEQINGVRYLNTERDIQNARDFFYTSADETTCTSNDPRLYDPIRNIRLELDRPPLQTKNTQPLQNIYDCKNKIQPQFYNGYSSIVPGDIQYWLDPDQSQLYNQPVYVIKSAVVPFIFQDPMGALKPQYDKIPLFTNQANIAEYSFDQDQMSFREDLMARQSRVINQSDFQHHASYFPHSVL